MKRIPGIMGMLLITALLLAHTLRAASPETEYTRTFDLDGCTFSSFGGNAFWSLEPGTESEFEGEDDGEEVTLLITALEDQKLVSFRTFTGALRKVQTRVIEEREWVDGELVEVSRNYFARCTQTNDIYYFGEAVDIFEDGEVSHAGAWLAGQNGAMPGIIMPGTFLLGSRYYQELAPRVALDRAEHVAMGLAINVPAGPMKGCVKIVETTPLEPGSESTKIYCPGVGLTIDNVVELTDHDAQGDD